MVFIRELRFLSGLYPGAKDFSTRFLHGLIQNVLSFCPWFIPSTYPICIQVLDILLHSSYMVFIGKDAVIAKELFLYCYFFGTLLHLGSRAHTKTRVCTYTNLVHQIIIFHIFLWEVDTNNKQLSLLKSSILQTSSVKIWNFVSESNQPPNFWQRWKKLNFVC